MEQCKEDVKGTLCNTDELDWINKTLKYISKCTSGCDISGSGDDADDTYECEQTEY